MKHLLFAWAIFFALPVLSASPGCVSLLEKQDEIVKHLNSDFVDFYEWDGYIHIIPDFGSWDWLNWIAAYLSLHHEKELLLVRDDETEIYSGAVALRYSEYIRLRKAFPDRKGFLMYLEVVVLSQTAED